MPKQGKGEWVGLEKSIGVRKLEKASLAAGTGLPKSTRRSTSRGQMEQNTRREAEKPAWRSGDQPIKVQGPAEVLRLDSVRYSKLE